MGHVFVTAMGEASVLSKGVNKRDQDQGRSKRVMLARKCKNAYASQCKMRLTGTARRSKVEKFREMPSM